MSIFYKNWIAYLLLPVYTLYIHMLYNVYIKYILFIYFIYTTSFSVCEVLFSFFLKISLGKEWLSCPERIAKLIKFPVDLFHKIEEYQKENHITSFTATVFELIRKGLDK